MIGSSICISKALFSPLLSALPPPSLAVFSLQGIGVGRQAAGCAVCEEARLMISADSRAGCAAAQRNPDMASGIMQSSGSRLLGGGRCPFSSVQDSCPSGVPRPPQHPPTLLCVTLRHLHLCLMLRLLFIYFSFNIFICYVFLTDIQKKLNIYCVIQVDPLILKRRTVTLLLSCVLQKAFVTLICHTNESVFR